MMMNQSFCYYSCLNTHWRSTSELWAIELDRFWLFLVWYSPIKSSLMVIYCSIVSINVCLWLCTLISLLSKSDATHILNILYVTISLQIINWTDKLILHNQDTPCIWYEGYVRNSMTYGSETGPLLADVSVSIFLLRVLCGRDAR